MFIILDINSNYAYLDLYINCLKFDKLSADGI